MVMSATVIAVLPALAVFLIAQRWIVKGSPGPPEWLTLSIASGHITAQRGAEALEPTLGTSTPIVRVPSLN
jgi:hypothetical protein